MFFNRKLISPPLPPPRPRLIKDTQEETRDIAAQMLNLVKNIPEKPFKYTIEAFGL